RPLARPLARLPARFPASPPPPLRALHAPHANQAALPHVEEAVVLCLSRTARDASGALALTFSAWLFGKPVAVTLWLSAHRDRAFWTHRGRRIAAAAVGQA
ncbi:MAG TPA: hypothetical protein RMG45_15755, partial [Polyangiaceae bacterium LLY-WYZ-15_(1-7)]|nr:hypothetical protein [Polyangiaceae bacterium LLY-WYZ-15_(1-7)]